MNITCAYNIYIYAYTYIHAYTHRYMHTYIRIQKRAHTYTYTHTHKKSAAYTYFTRFTDCITLKGFKSILKIFPTHEEKTTIPLFYRVNKIEKGIITFTLFPDCNDIPADYYRLLGIKGEKNQA